MQIRNRLFPYPVLNHNADFSNYVGLDFRLIYDEKESDSDYTMENVHFETDSSYLNQKIDEGLIGVACIIECSYTVYRKGFELYKEKGHSITLNKNDFSEKVIISMYAYAKKDFTLSSEEFDEDYRDISFYIEKNDILAANDGYSIFFKHEEEEDNFAHSIFNIIADHQHTESTYTTDYESSKKINIYLSDEEYKNYRIIYSVPSYKEVFFTMFLVNVLSEALAKCIETLNSSDNMDLEDLGNRFLWFRSIQNGYVKLTGNELNLDDFKKTSPSELAQQLLGKPLGPALKQLIEERNKVVMEEDSNNG